MMTPRIVLEIVRRHKDAGIHAVRYGQDIDIHVGRRDEAPIVAATVTADNFEALKQALGEYDAMFIRRDDDAPIVTLSWSTWINLLARIR